MLKSLFFHKVEQLRALVIVNAHALLLEYRAARNKIDMQAGSRMMDPAGNAAPAPLSYASRHSGDFIAFGNAARVDKSGCRIANPLSVQHAFKFKTREHTTRLRQSEYALALPKRG